ncbi:MAG TPA: hypothetical protein VGG39_12695 [Polyangiaceae bacterium]
MNRPPPRPPPLPARARMQHTMPAPTGEGTMSTRAKMSLADIALQLRDEQLEARIVHYKVDLETSPELDAVTAGVVAELQALQKAAGKTRDTGVPAPPADRAAVEIELISSLKKELARLFRTGEITATVQRKVGEASKRFARLFFESELCERIQGATDEQKKTMRFGAQALYHVLARAREALVAQLEGFEYASPEELEDAKMRLDDITKELRNQFLSATMPELNALVKWLNELLVTFFTAELPPAVGELAWEVVKEARLADSQARAGYKIGAEAFPRFRATFERKFLQRLVSFVEDGMLERVRGKGSEFRAETLRFVSDPQIFSDVCELVCDAVYDFLYNDGFLDLPADWRARLVEPS